MSDTVKDSIVKLRDRFDALQLREQRIVLILVLVIIAFLWDLLCYSPLQNSIKKSQDAIIAKSEQITRLGNQINDLVRPGKSSPMQVLQNREQNLQAAIKQLDGSIRQLTSDLIPAKKMVQVLEEVLHESSNLQLVAVKNLPVRRLITEREEADAPALGSSRLYLHAVELELRGNYFETLNYLRALEVLPWQVIWDQLEYRVDHYPKANIRLRINTLSSSAGLLGV